MIKSSLLLRIMISTVVFAIAMTAMALWLFRSGLAGITDMTKSKAV